MVQVRLGGHRPARGAAGRRRPAPRAAACAAHRAALSSDGDLLAELGQPLGGLQPAVDLGLDLLAAPTCARRCRRASGERTGTRTRRRRRERQRGERAELRAPGQRVEAEVEGHVRRVPSSCRVAGSLGWAARQLRAHRERDQVGRRAGRSSAPSPVSTWLLTISIGFCSSGVGAQVADEIGQRDERGAAALDGDGGAFLLAGRSATACRAGCG